MGSDGCPSSVVFYISNSSIPVFFLTRSILVGVGRRSRHLFCIPYVLLICTCSTISGGHKDSHGQLGQIDICYICRNSTTHISVGLFPGHCLFRGLKLKFPFRLP